ncbi:MAG: TonB-dependent receptor, partial [Bacteroidales bacterium]|nr:TonB-dependent receptor [Bacteroidales bacterium]
MGQHLYAQNIRGRVIDKSGHPIDFATVSIAGTSVGTVSDESGRFTIKADALPAFLVVRCLGYNEDKRLIEHKDIKSDIEIALSKSNARIDEVAVTAIGKKEQMSRTGFTTAVLETKSLESSPANINQALKTMPGLNIRVSGGVGSNFSLSL